MDNRGGGNWGEQLTVEGGNRRGRTGEWGREKGEGWSVEKREDR